MCQLCHFFRADSQYGMEIAARLVELDSGDRLSCELYGQRIAEATQRWQK
jgi:hypothetical protein